MIDKTMSAEQQKVEVAIQHTQKLMGDDLLKPILMAKDKKEYNKALDIAVSALRSLKLN